METCCMYLILDLDVISTVRGQQDTITFLDSHGADGTVLVRSTRTHSHHHPLVQLFLRLFWNVDTSGSFLG
jgi:hypothetical protein